MFIAQAGELRHLNQAIRTVVRATRLECDLSQQELAVRLHVSRNVIANFETGRRSIRAEELPLIATALRGTPETLFKRILAWIA